MRLIFARNVTAIIKRIYHCQYRQKMANIYDAIQKLEENVKTIARISTLFANLGDLAIFFVSNDLRLKPETWKKDAAY